MTVHAQTLSYLDVTLYPHRSMGKVGHRVLARLFVIPGLFIGVLTYVYNAWPIFVFYVIYTFFTYGMIRYHWFLGQGYEHVTLKKDILKIRHVPAVGPELNAEYQAQWVQIVRSEPTTDNKNGTLSIASHGHYTEIGSFLTEVEKKDLEIVLKKGLRDRQNDLIYRPD